MIKNNIKNISHCESRGFTLIELLVAVTIFIILTTLAISSFNYNIGSERITIAARNVQAKLEGAKSRAYGLSATSRRTVPVGVRLILDENSPRLVKGVTYVQGVQERPRGYLEFVRISSTVTAIKFHAGYNADSLDWNTLARQGILQGDAKILIGGQVKKSFSVSYENFLPAITDQRTNRPAQILMLQEVPTDVSFGDLTVNDFGMGTIAEYEIDVTHATELIPGETIQEFPPGIVIDLTQSIVPESWAKIGIWKENQGFSLGSQIVIPTSSGVKFAVATSAGVTAGSRPDFNSADFFTVIVDNDVRWQILPELKLDIMFSPQGTLMGKLATDGIIQLMLTERQDVETVFENDPTTTPPGQTTVGIVARDLRDRNGDGVKPDHLGSFRLITVNANSGAVAISPVDFTDERNNTTWNLGADDWADDIFNLARQGAESK